MLDCHHKKPTGVARRLRRLGTARTVCLATSLGMTISAAGLLAVGVAYMFVSDFRLVGFLQPAITCAGFVAVLMGLVLPALNRRIVREANLAPGPDLCLPLMEMVTGLPLGSLGEPVGEQLSWALRTTDSEWWSANHRAMATQVKLAFVSFENPSKLNPLDSPWVPALFDAMARCGRTEFLPKLERLESRSPRLDHPESLRRALTKCTASLRDRQRRDQEAATLLRVPASGDDLLLRPAGESAIALDSNTLLRPSGDSQTPSLAIPSPAVEDQPLENRVTTSP